MIHINWETDLYIQVTRRFASGSSTVSTATFLWVAEFAIFFLQF